MKRINSIIIVGFLCMFTASGVASETDTTTVVAVGDIVPDFTVKMDDGSQLTMSELRGKVILLNFFATWCGPCNTELELVQKEYWPKMKDVDEFVWVTIGREHSIKEVLDFKKKKGLTMPMGADPDRKIYSLFARMYIPRNFIIDKNGRIVWQEKGFDDAGYAEMKSKVQSLLDAS